MKKLLFFNILVFLIPISIISIFFNYNVKETISGFNSNKIEEKRINIRVLKSDNSIENMDLEEYLVGVVSSEVPVSFEEEALKAQAVASRTYALKQIENNKDKEYDVTDNVLSQVYSSSDQLKERWKDSYEENYNKIKKIVEETKGEYVSFDGEIIYAFFFSTSNGKTEDNKNVFGADLPYLKPVDSSFDKNETNGFISTVTLSKQEFYDKLGIDYRDKLLIDNVIKTESDRVYSLDINGCNFKGRDFQKRLSLRSNDFTFDENENSIIITTKGFGHGVGLSQYGSNALAKQKKNYKEILKYYYQGTEIKKL